MVVSYLAVALLVLLGNVHCRKIIPGAGGQALGGVDVMPLGGRHDSFDMMLQQHTKIPIAKESLMRHQASVGPKAQLALVRTSHAVSPVSAESELKQLQNELLQAAESGSEDEIDAIISEHGHKNELFTHRDENGQTALLWVVHRNLKAVARKLIPMAGPEGSNICDKEKNSPLLLAISNNDPEMAMLILDQLDPECEQDADSCRQANSSQNTALSQAIINDMSQVAMRLIDFVGIEGCVVTDDEGRNPLFLSTLKGDKLVSLKLLNVMKERPAACMLAIPSGHTPLINSIIHGQEWNDVSLQLIDVIGAAGCKMRLTQHEKSPLMLAVLSENEELAHSLMIALKHDRDAFFDVDEHGRTALHEAARRNMRNTAQILAEQHMGPEGLRAQDNELRTPLMSAMVQSGASETARALLGAIEDFGVADACLIKDRANYNSFSYALHHNLSDFPLRMARLVGRDGVVHTHDPRPFAGEIATPLDMACLRKDSDLATALLSMVTEEDDYKTHSTIGNAIKVALKYYQEDIAMNLLPHVTADYRPAALGLALEYGRKPVAEALIRMMDDEEIVQLHADAGLNLFHSVWDEMPHVSIELLRIFQHSAAKHVHPAMGYTALILSCRQGRTELALQLLEYLEDDADFCRRQTQPKRILLANSEPGEMSALMWAAINDMPEVLVRLLEIVGEEGRQATDQLGNDALMLAVANKNFECAKALIQSGATPTQNKQGNTALHVIAQMEYDLEADEQQQLDEIV